MPSLKWRTRAKGRQYAALWKTESKTDGLKTLWKTNDRSTVWFIITCWRGRGQSISASFQLLESKRDVGCHSSTANQSSQYRRRQRNTASDSWRPEPIRPVNRKLWNQFKYLENIRRFTVLISTLMPLINNFQIVYLFHPACQSRETERSQISPSVLCQLCKIWR